MIELRELQLCQLDIALDIKDICDRNGIKYYLIGGTLLGAVRHGGFIPWDDDLDIGMLRNDYNRFVSICEENLPDHLFLQTWDTDEGYALPFCKIMLKGTVFKEEVDCHSGSKSMIFVDVFPFDNRDDSIFRRKLNMFVNETARKLLQYKMGYDISVRSKHTVLHFFLKTISRLCSKNTLKKIIIAAETKPNKRSTKYVMNSCGAYRDREALERSGLEIEILKFEGYDFNVPIGRNQLLRNMYGDYMILPPVEKRGNRHKAVEADIGEYKIRNQANRMSGL